MTKPVVYIAGKFGDTSVEDEKRNRESARETAKKLWDIGYRAIVPHSMMGLPTPSEVESEQSEASREDVMSLCMQVLSTCDCIFLKDGWRQSSGSLREYNYAQRLGIATLRNFDEAEYYLNCVHFARTKNLQTNG